MKKCITVILSFLLLLAFAVPVMAAGQETEQPNAPVWLWIGLAVMGVSALMILILAWKQGGKGKE